MTIAADCGQVETNIVSRTSAAILVRLGSRHGEDRAKQREGKVSAETLNACK
jgi:hypothetical protein